MGVVSDEEVGNEHRWRSILAEHKYVSAILQRLVDELVNMLELSGDKFVGVTRQGKMHVSVYLSMC